MDPQQIIKFGRKWLPSFFSETDGTGSSTRLFMGLIVGFVVGAGTALAFKIHAPVSVADLCAFLSAAGLFIATSCGPLMLINKGADVFNKRAERPDQPNV